MKRAGFLLALLLAAVLLTPTLPGIAAPPPATPPPVKEAPLPTAPVLLDRKAVFTLPAFHSVTAEERASRIGERITRIARDLTIPVDSITIADADIATDILAGDRILLSVYDADARTAGVSRQELAREYAGKIRAAVEEYRYARLPKSISRGIILSVVATVVLFGAVLLLRVLSRKLQRVAEAGIVRSIRFHNIEILRLEQVKSLVSGCIRVVRFVLLLLLFYVYLHVLLISFPWTRPFSGEIRHHLVGPLKTMGAALVGFIPNLIFLVILVAVTYYLLTFMRLIAGEVEKGKITFAGFYPEWAKPTYRIVRFLVIAFVAVVAFPYLPGSDSPAFKGVTIFLGVLLSLGSSSTVSNIIAGLDLTYRRAFLPGDWVKIGEVTGKVSRMRLLVTHLETFKNEEVVVPNAVILNSHVTNYSSLARGKGLIIHTSVTIGYTTPWRQVHAFLLQAAERTAGLLRQPPPFVLQTALDDFYVRYELNAYTDAPEKMLDIYSDLHLNIQDAFNEYEVQIMSPHYVFDPRSPAVVPKERWYPPPARPPGEDAGGQG